MCHAVIAAEGEQTKMTTENIENATKDATVGAQGSCVAPQKAPSKKNASSKKGAPKGQKGKGGKPKVAATAKAKKAAPAKTAAKAPKATKPKAEADGVRASSKTATILELLRRPKGASLAEVMEATSWQAHSCRGFISGTLGKKMGLTVKSEKRDDGTRVYSIAR